METVDIPNICEILNNEVDTLDVNKYFDQNIDPDVFQERNSICKYYTEHKINESFSDNENLDFSIISFNCRSLRANFKYISDCLAGIENKFHVITLTETWLNERDDINMYSLEGYTFHCINRKNIRGGGVGMCIKSDLYHEKVEILSASDKICMEEITFVITLNNNNIMCLVFIDPQIAIKPSLLKKLKCSFYIVKQRQFLYVETII